MALKYLLKIKLTNS